MAEVPACVHALWGRCRRAFKSFEKSRSDEPPYHATWQLEVTVEYDELDKVWIAECRDLPGCMSQGDTAEEALDNLSDAIGGVVAVKIAESAASEYKSSRYGNARPSEAKKMKVAISA